MKKLNLNLTIILILTALLSPFKAIAIDSSELNLLGGKASLNLANLTELNLNIQQLYDTEQYQQIIPLLQTKIQNYERENNLTAQIKTWRDLAFIYEKLGNINQAFASLENSLKLWQNLNENGEKQILLAQILDVQGQIELTSGQSEKALETWSKSVEIYRQNNDILALTTANINQVQALRTLGLYNQAMRKLTEITEVLNNQPDHLLKAQALHTLGDVLQKVGKLDQAKLTLEQALEITKNHQAENNNWLNLTAEILISLGNISEETEALTFYEQAIAINPNLQIKIYAQLEQLSLLTNRKNTRDALNLIPEISTNLNQLPLEHNTIYNRINLAKHLIKLNQSSDALENLTTAIQQAQTIGDQRAEAYALGNLGKLYEQNQRYQEAEELTQKALIIAQSINAPDLAYQWQWQLGRILNSQDKINNRQEAINIYSLSVKTLQSIRSELVAISSDNQFTFRESVEPVYRELASLLLQPEATQEELRQAREIIESLQLAEMDNFFKDACLDAKPVKIDELDPHAAIFYTIILPDRLEVIVAIAGQPLINYRTEIPQTGIENAIEKAQMVLTNTRRPPSFYLPILQEPYQWLIKPIETQLKEHNIETLVFIPDGKLRNIPFAPLYDGDKYLIEKYNIALAPSLQLIDPQEIARQNLSMLFGGLSEARQGYDPLPSVEIELNKIQQAIKSDILFNPNFTENLFSQQLNSTPYPIVHLATHGEFSSKAEDTYLLTWDDKIDINELHYLLNQDQKQKQPIELLVLSACKTAVGDDRAALGLAGIAVRAGARSTLGSLWYVNDESTSLLMSNFYQELAQGNMTKSEALRNAQLKIIEDNQFSHPYYWSPFVLLGNWL